MSLDPAVIGKRLAWHRSLGASFEEAWREATGLTTAPHSHGNAQAETVRDFMLRHFRAAYERLPLAAGRFHACTPDTSSAVVERERGPMFVGGGCRSGDGCLRPATHGRFGPAFCAGHHAELRRVAESKAPAFNPGLADLADAA